MPPYEGLPGALEVLLGLGELVGGVGGVQGLLLDLRRGGVDLALLRLLREEKCCMNKCKKFITSLSAALLGCNVYHIKIQREKDY